MYGTRTIELLVWHDALEAASMYTTSGEEEDKTKTKEECCDGRESLGRNGKKGRGRKVGENRKMVDEMGCDCIGLLLHLAVHIIRQENANRSSLGEGCSRI
jgi:hypothetical protein